MKSIQKEKQMTVKIPSTFGMPVRAWQNLVAESWSRVRRKAATAFVVGALTVSVGACGNTPTADDTAPSKAEDVASAPAIPAIKYDTSFNEVKPASDQAAVSKFGAKGVAAGTAAAVDVTEEYAYNADLLVAKQPEGKAAALAAGKHMTPSTQKEWNGLVNKFTSKDGELRAEAAPSVFSLTFYTPFVGSKSKGKPMDIQRTGAPAVNPTIKSVHSSMSGDGEALQVVVSATAELRITVGDEAKRITADRETTYSLMPSADGWKIDGWSGTYNISEPHAGK